jgi:hypothetical protein
MGILLELLWITFVIVAIAFAFSQVIIPVMEGTRLFPIFRKRGEIQEELVDAKEALATEKIKTEVKSVKSKIKKEREGR